MKGVIGRYWRLWVGFVSDQMLLLKRGGQVIYMGHLGQRSQNLVEYFEVRIKFLSDGAGQFIVRQLKLGKFGSD